MQAECFGALYLREIETLLWSEFASGVHTEQSSRLLGLERRAKSMRVAPTHISPSGGATLIDLALIYEPSSLLDCSVCPPLANSDHKGALSP